MASHSADLGRRKGFFLERKQALLIGTGLALFFLVGILLTLFLRPTSFIDTEEEYRERCYSEACPAFRRPEDWYKTCSSIKDAAKSKQHGNARTKTEKLSSMIDYRLPRNLKPYYYDLTIKPYFNVTTMPTRYDGHVSIRFTCVEDTSRLVMHINNLEVENETLEVSLINDTASSHGPRNGTGSSGPVERLMTWKKLTWFLDAKRQFFIVEFGKRIFRKGRSYMVEVGFKGLLKDDNAGLYASSYVDSNGNRRWLMASLMAPLEARKSFICFDEPDMKARFRISVIHDSSLHSLSNMPIVSIKKLESDGLYDWMQTDFDETVDMSTYLVALVVSDFKCIQSSAKPALSKHINVSLCARPNAIHQLDFSLNVAVKVLEFFESHFNIEYPLPKSDHVALPDFSAGAMENWGLITYRESRLLYDPLKTSQSAEQYMVEVIAHEVSHMWFGNLVSPKWWNDLWLNEGFARFMQFLGTDHVRPQWHMFDQFMLVWFLTLDLDSVASSHAVSVNVSNPIEVIELFDGITYGKGGSVIRMMNYILGPSTFNQGVTKYLSAYQYGNADQGNLWDSLDEQATLENKIQSLDLKEIMNTWTRQLGHPVITIETLDSSHVRIRQKHFLFDSSSTPVPSVYNYSWFVPFTYSIEAINSHQSLVNTKNMSNIYDSIIWLFQNETEKIITLDKELNNDTYLIANLDAAGFFRVNYDQENWRKISNQLLNYKASIPVKMRAQIVNDVFSLAQASQLDPTRPFELIRYLANEFEMLPWDAAINRLGFLVNMLESTEVYGDFNGYLLELVDPLYKKLTWQSSPTDSWLDRQLRTKILDFACARGSLHCVAKAQELFKQWMANSTTNNIPKDFRVFVYCTAVKYGTRVEWDFMSHQYDLEVDSNAKKEMQNALSCAREPWLLNKYLSDQLNNTKVRKQDTLYGLRYACTKPLGNILAWDFIKSNWNQIYARYGSTMTFSSLINDLASKFNTENAINEFVKFFSEVSTGSATREVRIAAEKIRTSITWMRNNFDSIQQWFATRSPLSPTA